MSLSFHGASRWCGWAVGLACLVTSPAAFAQMGLSPLVIETEAQRGRAQGVLRVNNNGGEAMRVRVYAEPFTYERDNGFMLLENSPEDLTPYLQFSPRELVIPAQSERRVRLISIFPPNLPEGEYRAVIFTEPLDATRQVGSNVGIVTRVGATIYVRQGKVPASLAVTSAQWNVDQQHVELLVANSGTGSARPKAQWTIQRAGETVTSGETVSTSVVAGGDRNLHLTPDRPLTPGTYEITGELSWRDGETELTQPFSISLNVS
ncbi:hypothetical protein Lepto7375DRAFT_3882 [Leptolyngbya sp. PCC 7375]|nr:hypothetical protein Lepto7375DRAFT_3882 [Leptolyngbya sp. PCC 7375]